MEGRRLISFKLKKGNAFQRELSSSARGDPSNPTKKKKRRKRNRQFHLDPIPKKKRDTLI